LWDPLSSLTHVNWPLLPIYAFLAGLLGGVHCLCMCGPLVLSFTKNYKQNFIYHGGRLLGYLLLGPVISVVSLALIEMGKLYPKMILFLVWSVVFLVLVKFFLKRFNKKKLRFYFVEKISAQITNKIIINKSGPFVMGLASLLLPCSMLYGVLLALSLFEKPWWAALCIFFFWLGTLPWVILAPQVLAHLFSGKLKKHQNKISTLTSALALLMISWRLWLYSLGVLSCH